MENLLFTINVIMPIILITVLGYVLKRLKFFDEKFLLTANKFCFKVLLPVLLFYNIYNITSFSEINIELIIYVIASIIILFTLGFFFVYFFIKEPKQKGVILQASFRSNYAIIGIPLATMLSGIGTEATIVASLVAAISVPLFNIFAVISLSIFSDDENAKVDYKDVLKKIITNPLIIGVLLGLLTFSFRMLLKSININFTIKENIPFIYSAIESIARVTTPLALIVLGGRFTFKAIGRLKKQIIIGVVIRIVIVPLVFLRIAVLFGFGALEFPALIALFATPAAVSSVPMAQQMKADDELAGQIVVWTTILSAISLFIIILTCKNLGII